MSDLPSRWEIEELPSHDPRWTLVERIASSGQFQKAPQLRNILFYIAARSLTENPVAISEQQIGLTVLGRGRDFDPNQDNIVRVRIRHLRMKLEEYFGGEGSSEPVVLTIPKGCYVARFEPRPTPAEQPAEKDHGGAGNQPPAAPREFGQRRLRLIGFALVVIAIAIGASLLLWRRISRSAPPSAVSASTARADYLFYQDLLGPLGRDPASETRLVVSNPRLMVYVGSPSPHEAESANAIPVPPDLAPKLAPATNHRDEALPYHFIRITDQDYTGIGEAGTCFYLGQLMQILDRRVGLTQGRFLNWDSARQQNLIIVGSPDINEWAYQNLPKENYSIEKLGIRNEKPRLGEPAVYQVLRSSQTGTPLVDYGLIWMSRSPSGSRILVLAGCTSPGTAGVGSFFADPGAMRAVYEKLKAEDGRPEFPSDWQVVVKVNIRDNLPIETQYVAHRVYSTTP